MKNKMIILILFSFISYFILFPQEAFAASCDGILLWFYQILPSLLPYAILSNIILSSNLPEYLSERISKLHNRREYQSRHPKHALSDKKHAAIHNKQPRFEEELPSAAKPHTPFISVSEAFVIFCGFLFGFPIGSKLTADLRKQGVLTKERAQILCAFTNNMSPTFVSNFVLTQTLGRSELFGVTCLILYGIPLLYGCIRLIQNAVKTNQRYILNTSYNNIHVHTKTRTKMDNFSNNYLTNANIMDNCTNNNCSNPNKYPYTSAYHNHPSTTFYQKDSRKNPASRFHMDMQIIDAGITNSFETLVRLCGYIVMFSILAHIIQQLALPGVIGICLTGLLEVTNGVSAISSGILSEAQQYLLAIVFTGFGGISGIAQAGSMILPANLSMRQYVKDKILITMLIGALTLAMSIYR